MACRMFQNACRMLQNACRIIYNACRMFQNTCRRFQNTCRMFQNACRMFQSVPKCMQIYELACNYISLHAVTLACMQFLSSSEQLTRISQCLFKLMGNLCNIQGDWLERSESYCLLLQKYGFYCPPKPTRGSPDMVHLIIYASQQFR